MRQLRLHGCRLRPHRDKDGQRIDRGEWENALFILTSVMSHAKPDLAVCDAGLKAQSVDSGLPVIHGREDVTYIKCSDEHGVIGTRPACSGSMTSCVLCPAIATRPAMSMTGMSVSGTARSKPSGRSAPVERAIDAGRRRKPDRRTDDARAAFDAIEAVFAAMARRKAGIFQSMREALGYQDALYGFRGRL